MQNFGGQIKWIMGNMEVAYCLIQTKGGWIPVYALWDKQHMTHIVRKRAAQFAKFSSLVLIGPTFKLFQNLKIFQIAR